MEIVIWVIAGIVLGAAGGAGFTYWWTRARGGGDTIGQLKRENQKFREEVTEHFVETARLINQLTDSYKEVFDHLNKGATELIDEKALADRLPASDRGEVRLKRLGASTASSDRGGDDPGSKKRDEAESEGNRSAGSGRTENPDASGNAGTRADGGKSGSEKRKPHERADIEAGPRRESDKRSDSDVDPLKRGAGGGSSSSGSPDSSSDKATDTPASGGERQSPGSSTGPSTGSGAKSDSESASGPGSKSDAGSNAKSGAAKTTGGPGGADAGKSSDDDKNSGSKSSGS